MPWRRLRMISSRCCCSGRPLISTTLSSMRVNTRTTSRYSSQSKRACGVNGSRTKRVRFTEPSRHEPYGGSGCSPHGIGGADVLAPPVVVHLVDAVDQDEARLGEIVGGGHDDVPHAPRRQRLVDPAGHQAVLVDDVALVRRPLAPDELAAGRSGPACRPRTRCASSGNASFQSRSSRTACMNSSVISSDRLNWRRRPFSRLARMKSIDVGMADVERAHLRAAPAAGRGHGEAHLVVDIHERQRPGGVGAGARDVGAARPQRRELVADAAAGLERQARLVHLVEDVVHRIADRAGHGAVDGGGGGLVLQRAGIGGDAPGRNRAVAQRPQETLVPVLAHAPARSTSASARATRL